MAADKHPTDGRLCRRRAGPSLALGVLLGAGMLVLLSGCSEEQKTGVVVKRIESRAELAGGPLQYGDEGDFLLQNSKIRAVVLDAGHGASPALWGGALVDIDLVRPFAEFRAGNGLDQFFLIHPMVNLNVPNPETGGVHGWVSPDGKRGVVRVVGNGDRVLAVLNLMDIIKDLPATIEEMLGMDLPTLEELLKGLYGIELDLDAALDITTRVATLTDYILEEDNSYIEIVTVFRAIGGEECANKKDDDGDGLKDCADPDCSLDYECPDWCAEQECPDGAACHAFWGGCFQTCGAEDDCATGECDQVSGLCVPVAREMKALKSGTNLLDILSGGSLSLIGELSGDMGDILEVLPDLLAQITEKPGFVTGDMPLLGSNAHTFVPGIGYELDTQYRLMFMRGINALLDPMAFDAMTGVAEKVSYGYFTRDGSILFPFSTESLTASMTHGLNCLHASDDDAECDELEFSSYTRYVAVGDGDVASVYDTIYEVRGTPHGRVKGHVYDIKSFQPISEAQVFAIADPCDEERCTTVAKDCGDFATYIDLAEAARLCSATPATPDGQSMVMSQFVSDRGMDFSPDGSFDGPLAPGVYYLVARKDKRPFSAPAKLEIEEGKTKSAALFIPEPGVLEFRVLDEAARQIPARVTVGHCFPECRGAPGDCPAGQVCDEQFQCRKKGGCSSGADCDPDEVCAGGTCTCNPGHLPGDFVQALGDGYLSDRKVVMELAPDGEGSIELPPGHYDVVFSRGVEYSIDSREVSLLPAQPVFVDAKVYRVVDTTGWISYDQHMHSAGSPDSSVSNYDRLDSALCDGLEVMVMTDHDYIRDLEPYIRELGLWQSVVTWPGDEISTLDVSHLIGFPLHYSEFESAHGALNWQGMTPGDIFTWVRSNGLLPPEEMIVTVAHPRGGMTSYFDVFGVNPYTLEMEQGQVQQQTPLLAPEELSPAFDLIEIMNSKRFDIPRIPTYLEVAAYNEVLAGALANQENKSRQEILGELIPSSGQVVRSLLARTPAEQEAIWRYNTNTPLTLCGLCEDDGGCPEGHACRDVGVGICMVPCDEEAPCGGDAECLDGFCGDPANLPCHAIKGLTDDWLRMLNYGVFKVGVGGSDIHGISNYEVGCLRNYVKSPTDDPVAVDLPALTRTYRKGQSFTTYGPFVDFTIDGKGPGETVALGDGAKLKIRLQSPLWFDVSRVEIIRNGVMEYVFDVDAADEKYKIALPNDGIVNVEATVDIKPGQDSWYVVFAMGVQGRAMTPVYGSAELPPVYLGDLFQSVFGSLPIDLPTYMTFPKVPVYYPQLPYAVTNPIFVDVDGKDENGCLITPQEGPPPEWLCNYPDDYPAEHLPCVCN